MEGQPAEADSGAVADLAPGAGMSDVLISVLFAAIAGGFATFAIWSLRRLQDDVHETADLDRRVSRLERMAWPNWLQDGEGEA